jgi:hypothetical protein
MEQWAILWFTFRLRDQYNTSTNNLLHSLLTAETKLTVVISEEYEVYQSK